MKAYIKKNLVESGNGRFIVPSMRKLEGTIIDVVWVAGDDTGIPGWRTESSPWYFWDDDWLMILPDGYDLAKAISVIFSYQDAYAKMVVESSKSRIKISDMEKEIIELKKIIMDKDNIIAGCTMNLDSLKRGLEGRDSTLSNVCKMIDSYYGWTH